MRTIACVACLDPRRSVHTTTFLRAIELARDFVVAEDVHLCLYDDQASAQGGLYAARQVIASAPHAVVGHFASASAAVAAPCYAQHGLPLFLPAATSRGLTLHYTTYRVCDHDQDYAEWLCGELAERGWGIEQLRHDGSVHGKSVVSELAGHAQTYETSEAVTVFAGMYAHAVAFVKAHVWSDHRQQPIILCDDAWSANLPGDLLALGVAVDEWDIHVACIRAQGHGALAETLREAWRQRWGGEPGSYFWETLAAIEAGCDFPRLSSQTVVGAVTFDVEGESRPGHFSLAKVTAQGLVFSAASELTT